MANSLAQSRAITTQFRLAYSGLDFKDNQKLKALAEVLESTSRDHRYVSENTSVLIQDYGQTCESYG